MDSFKRILVPTDFSEPAARALILAIELARPFESQITLLHVVSFPAMAYGAGVYFPVDECIEQGKKSLSAALANAQARYPRIDGEVVSGTVAHEILAVAKSRDVDLVVMGTHGLRGLQRALLGSVTERIVRTSPVPVLTVPPSNAGDSGVAGEARARD
jgi:nucleotide-binding universal stress UspA family protein